MLRSRQASWRTPSQALALGAMLMGGAPAFAMDPPEDTLTVAEERGVPEKDDVGESVGEPAVEDAPVDGEPGPGDDVQVPLDESGDAGDGSQPPEADDAGEPKRVE